PRASATSKRRRSHPHPVPISSPTRDGVATRTANRATACQDPAVRSGVLIVDDNAGFRLRARELLESEGFEVVGEAADADSALAAMRQLAPDIVLLDVQLPDRDGFEVAKQLT